MELEFYDYMPLITQGDCHTLIAGVVGSGKSVLLNGIILHSMTIDGSGLYLIDPKRVELSMYRSSVHCASYGDTDETIIQTLKFAQAEMHRRFADMQKRGLRKTDLPPRYVVIDELAMLSTKINKELAKVTNPILSDICVLGRASKIFLVACTQRPTQDVITPLIKVNCDCRIALRMTNEYQSRNIIDVGDAHYLPRYGYCYMAHPDFIGVEKKPVRLYPDSVIEQAVEASKRKEQARPAPKEQKKQKNKSLFDKIFGL